MWTQRISRGAGLALDAVVTECKQPVTAATMAATAPSAVTCENFKAANQDRWNNEGVLGLVKLEK